MYGFRNNEKYAHISIASRGMQHLSYSSNNNDYSMCYCYVNKYGGGNRLLNQSKSYFSSGFRSGCATRNLKKNGGVSTSDFT